MPTGRPPAAPPYSAFWRINGVINDSALWETSWHLSLEGGLSFDYLSVRELHEDLLLFSEEFFRRVMASGVVATLSRLTAHGPVGAVTHTGFLTSNGDRGSPCPVNTAVCVLEMVNEGSRGRPGRFFLPAPAFDDTSLGWQLNAGATQHYDEQLALFFDGVNSVSTPVYPRVRFAVLHRQEDKIYLEKAVIELVDTWVLAKKLSHQDRRLQSVRQP
jgi:hypothetical protein